VFLLYPVLAGLAAGLLSGGRLSTLARIPLRWTNLIVAGMALQLILFSTPIGSWFARLGPMAGPGLYVASMAMVLAAVLRNIRIPGLALIAVGAASNLLAIVANGGYMPASAAALGEHLPSGVTNSVLSGAPALPLLTDIFALPRWLPAGNVFSVGDICIGLGVALAIVIQMRLYRGVNAPVLLISTWPKGLGPGGPGGPAAGSGA
jgi:hypothetical protein